MAFDPNENNNGFGPNGGMDPNDDFIDSSFAVQFKPNDPVGSVSDKLKQTSYPKDDYDDGFEDEFKDEFDNFEFDASITAFKPLNPQPESDKPAFGAAAPEVKADPKTSAPEEVAFAPFGTPKAKTEPEKPAEPAKPAFAPLNKAPEAPAEPPKPAFAPLNKAPEKPAEPAKSPFASANKAPEKPAEPKKSPFAAKTEPAKSPFAPKNDTPAPTVDDIPEFKPADLEFNSFGKESKKEDLPGDKIFEKGSDLDFATSEQDKHKSPFASNKPAEKAARLSAR